MLVEAGGNANAHKTNGWTPLMYASSGGYLELVQLLLRAIQAQGSGAVDERNREGASALHLVRHIS